MFAYPMKDTHLLTFLISKRCKLSRDGFLFSREMPAGFLAVGSSHLPLHAFSEEISIRCGDIENNWCSFEAPERRQGLDSFPSQPVIYRNELCSHNSFRRCSFSLIGSDRPCLNLKPQRDSPTSDAEQACLSGASGTSDNPKGPVPTEFPAFLPICPSG